MKDNINYEPTKIDPVFYVFEWCGSVLLAYHHHNPATQRQNKVNVF